MNRLLACGYSACTFPPALRQWYIHTSHPLTAARPHPILTGFRYSFLYMSSHYILCFNKVQVHLCAQKLILINSEEQPIIIDVRHRLLLLSTLFFAAVVLNAEVIALQENDVPYSLNSALRYIVNQDKSLSVHEVYKLKDSSQPFPKKSMQIPRDGEMWLFFTLHNRSSSEFWVLENEMNVELMQIYLQDKNKNDTIGGAVAEANGKDVHEAGAWEAGPISGNSVAFSERVMRTRKPAFELQVEPGEEKEVMLRVFDLQSASVRLKLMSRSMFLQSYNHETLLLGLAFGFFAALIIYNLIVYAINKDRIYLVYSLYMLAFFFNQFCQERLFSQYITPNQPYGFFWFIIFGGATAAFGLEFFRCFIETKKKMPRIDLLMRIVSLLLVLLIISGFFYAGPISADLLNVISLLAMGLILTALGIRIVKKDVLALVCLLGSLLYLFGTIAEIIVTLVPVQVNSFVLNAQLYGALTQVLFLGFALGAKTAHLRLEYDQMQRRYQEDLEENVRQRTLELEEVNKKLAEHAMTDALTGLYNRMELSRRTKEIDPYLSRKGGAYGTYVVSVAYLDLDNFKYYNDTYGHGYGDQLLQKTAENLQLDTRGYDLIFRLGGDEFLIIMPETELDEATQIVERVHKNFGSSVPPESKVSLSIGVSSSRQFQSADVEELIHAADTALLRAKGEGKNRISMHYSAVIP